jgi:hypothetical protein
VHRRDNFEPPPKMALYAVNVNPTLHNQTSPLTVPPRARSHLASTVKAILTAELRVTARRRRPVVLTAVAFACVAAILLTATGARAATFTWSSPTLVGTPTSPITTVSCASPTLCVAVSGSEVYTSTAPAADQWTAATVDASAPLVVLSCFAWGGLQCVAIDSDGYVFWSQNPAAGARSWVRSRHSIDNQSLGGAEVTGLSCGDEGWCVAVDALGNVLTQYQTPVGGWHTTSDLAEGEGWNLTTVSCTPTFCLVAGIDGSVWVDRATHGVGAWQPAPGVTSDDRMLAKSVSCVTGGLCVLISPDTTTTDPGLDPFGPSSAWSTHWNADQWLNQHPSAVSCASLTLCVGINSAPSDYGIPGIAIVSTSPRYPGSFTGPAATVQTIEPASVGRLKAISCVADSASAGAAQLCAISDSTGHLITGTYPRAG